MDLNYQLVPLLRKAKGLSQHDLANRIGVSRSLLAMYERGERVLDVTKLDSLKLVLGIGSGAVTTNSQFATVLKYRASDYDYASSSSETEAVLDREVALVIQPYIDRCTALGVEFTSPISHEWKGAISSNISRTALEVCTHIYRQFGVLSAPLPHLRSSIESIFKLPVFVIDLPMACSEVYVLHKTIGACLFVAKSNVVGRQRFSLLHGLGHHLLNSGAYISGEEMLEEELCNNIAEICLLPARQIRSLFEARFKDRFTPLDLISISDQFGVSTSFMANRLSSLGLIRVGTYALLLDRGFSPTKFRVEFGLNFPRPLDGTVYPKVYMEAVKLGIRSGSLTEAAVIDFLSLSRHHARMFISENKNSPPSLFNMT